MKNLWLFLTLSTLSTALRAQEFKELPVWQFNVFFETGKADIQSAFLPKLDSLINGMKEDSSFRVSITAHTDNTGSDVSNEKLSKNRAESIKNYLILHGINDIRLKYQWKGELEPVSENNTEGGKSQNRRVAIEVFRRIYIAKVTSVVKNDLGAVIPNATVTMRSKYMVDSTFTDSTGTFTINVPYKQPAVVEVIAKDHFYDKKVLNLGVLNVKIQDFIIAKAEIGKKLKIRDLNFVGNEAIVLPESKPNLKILLLFMRLNPTYKVELAGHVNASGFIASVKSFEYRISVERAKTVYDYLIENGISKERMIYKGYANWEMKFPYPSDDEQHKANRRVEVRIIEK